MEKSTIGMINKCEIDSQRITLKEKDKTIEAERNDCSSFMKSLKLLAQGECNNLNHKSRNAIITFTDLVTGKVKGKQNLYLLYFDKFFDF